jgi:hypothetical protein
MEWNYDNIRQWFDTYFGDVRKFQGSLDTVPNLRKYFADDVELVLYTSPSSPPAKHMSRDELLISFVHPGLQEDIIPAYYAIDVKQKIVAVQFEIQFSDRPSQTAWPPLQASAHYHLKAGEDGEPIIGKIFYWTEALPNDLFGIWAAHREEELNRHALKAINAKS